MRTNILLTAIIAIMVTVSTKADNIGDSKTKQAHSISTRYEAGAVYGSGDYAPMWHIANRQGMGSYKSNWAYARLAVNGKNTFSNGNIALDWGADIVGGYNLTSPVFIQQAYFDFSWKKINISLGQKERWGYIQNPRLSSGALVESGNARPIPQIRIELPEYWNIPGTKGWFGIRGHLAYGWFTDEYWQKEFVKPDKAHTTGVRYHSKAGAARIGNVDKFPLTAEMGLYMVTQFGGNTHNHLNEEGVFVDSPTRFKDYLTAFIPTKGDSQYTIADQANVAGNMLGSWFGSLTWDDKAWKLRLTYEHVFEDHSQMFWEYGLWTEQLVGLELELKKFKWIKSATFEYFNLKDQSGPIYHDTNSLIPDQISCVDNNYWHHTYNGWFNYGMMIGTPFTTSPVYNTDGTLEIYNNRTEAFHFGIEGSPLDWMDYRLLLSRSNNWGTYKKPFTEVKHCTSGLAEFTFRPDIKKRWSITASFAFDKGDLYGNNYGGMITITRRDIFKY
ncbi:MAG: hypothetical protein J6R07_01555 [Bacteroidaceae bacterium]|nr:hypothetical protein [Bacteroidaceae bacterium]